MSHRLTPSISISSQVSDDGDGMNKERGRGRRGIGKWFRSLGSGSSSRDPSPTPYRGRRGSTGASSTRSSSAERGISAANSDESDEEEDGVAGEADVVPNHAYEDDDTDSDFSDEELEKNTEANTGEKTVDEMLDLQTPIEPTHDGLPNLIRKAMHHPHLTSPMATRKRTKSANEPTFKLEYGKPTFERNRCSIIIKHGNPEQAAEEAKRTRTYFVATDLSEESQYAIEWCIGTVLRDGDDCLIASVIENDDKLDPEETQASASDKRAKIANQRERQDTALAMQRIAASLLERTRLHVRVTCQAIHAKNARHMLVDMIDYMDPTMVIIGSRGLSKIKGMLLGSVSHYLVQKSSVPVMVARRRLRRPVSTHRPKSSLDRGPRVRSLAQAQIDKESHGSAVKESDLHDAEQGNEAEDGSTVHRASTA